MELQKKVDGTDWRDDKSLVKCMIHMLTEEVMCDVTFRVGRDKTPIKAHKYMLASRSPVFYTMFEGSLPETGEINVPDIDENIFQIILRYIYSDELTLSNENVKDTLYAADKYMLWKVKMSCSDYLKVTACSCDASVALQAACQFGLKELQETSLAYIESNTEQCLSSEHTMQLPKECMEIILRSDTLSCSETDILKCVLKWAKVRCTEAKQEIKEGNLRNIIGNLLPLVRFPLVDKEYFATVISDADLLTLPEIVSVFRSHYGVPNIFFSNEIRKPLTNQPYIEPEVYYTPYTPRRRGRRC